MIDWLSVFYNVLWILGLAVILAAFSYNDWLAAQNNVKLRRQFGSPAFQLPLSLGLALLSLGLTLLADVWWEQLVWLVFTGLFLFQVWQARTNVK